jgi:hypothetical protein
MQHDGGMHALPFAGASIDVHESCTFLVYVLTLKLCCRYHQKELKAGLEVEVYWNFYKKYYKGTIMQYNPRTSKATVLYDDGDEETFLMHEEEWRFPSRQVCTSGVSPSRA